MADADDIQDAIVENAQGPKRVQADGVNVEQHSIEDQIKAERHITGVAGAAKAHRGLRFTKLIPAGPRDV